MSAQWVIPGWPETDEHFTCRPQEGVHDTQYPGWVGEMLKRVHGNDNVRKLFRRRCEEARILNTSGECLLSCRFEDVPADIDAGHAPGPFCSHFNRIGSVATAEVDDTLPDNPGKEIGPH